MKYARATFVAFALFTSGVAAACASGSTDTVFADGGGLPTTGHGHGNGGAGGAGGGMTCVAQCKSDQDCQTTCPTLASGANCCAMGVCYVEPAACPGSGPAGSTGTAMY